MNFLYYINNVLKENVSRLWMARGINDSNCEMLMLKNEINVLWIRIKHRDIKFSLSARTIMPDYTNFAYIISHGYIVIYFNIRYEVKNNELDLFLSNQAGGELWKR